MSNFLNSKELKQIRKILDNLNKHDDDGSVVSVSKAVFYDLNGEELGYLDYVNKQYVFSPDEPDE
jgi:hypothetical protein